MARVPVRVLESELALTEIHAPRDARLDHPLERAIDRRAADSPVLRPDRVDERVGADVAFLPHEDRDDDVPFRRAAASGRPVRLDEFVGRQHGEHAAVPVAGEAAWPILAARNVPENPRR